MASKLNALASTLDVQPYIYVYPIRVVQIIYIWSFDSIYVARGQGGVRIDTASLRMHWVKGGLG